MRKILSRISSTYRIKHGWGLECIRNKREARALYRFCHDWLSERVGTEGLIRNPERAKIFMNTMILYRTTGPVKCGCSMCRHEGNRRSYYNFSDYVNDHCGWYWD